MTTLASRLHYRQAQKADMPWAYALFRRHLKPYIEQTWGWDEVFQQHSFEVNLPAADWQIVSVSESVSASGATPASGSLQDVAAYCVKHRADHIHLAMLVVQAERQGQGLGRRIITHIQQLASARGSEIRLSVLKCNPAHHFYRATGFLVTAQDPDRYQFNWTPPSSTTARQSSHA